MGKRYKCDYCDKTMVAAPSTVRTHNNGMAHQKLVHDHYQQFKDPETILNEEAKKKPCSRFANGQCQFGSICRYSHYSREQIKAIGEYVATKNLPKDIIFPSFRELFHKLLDEKTNTYKKSNNGDTVVYDNNGVTHVFPWTYNTILESYGNNLPPSVKRLTAEDFSEARIESWG